MSMPTASQLLGGGGKSIKFENLGDGFDRAAVLEHSVEQATNFDTGEPDFWDEAKTKPKYQVKVKLQLTEYTPTDEDDDGRRSLYLIGNKLRAAQDALKAAGVKDFAPDGLLSMHWTSNGTPKNPRFAHNPPKLYTASYEPPSATSIAAAPAVQAPVAAPIQQPVPVQANPAVAAAAANVQTMPVAVFNGLDAAGKAAIQAMIDQGLMQLV